MPKTTYIVSIHEAVYYIVSDDIWLHYAITLRIMISSRFLGGFTTENKQNKLSKTYYTWNMNMNMNLQVNTIKMALIFIKD